MEELMVKYLAGELDEKGRVDFESQLIQDESLRLEFATYMYLWELQDKNASSHAFDTEKAWSIVDDATGEDKIKPIEIKKDKFSFIKIAATLLLMAVAGYFLIKGITPDKTQEDQWVERVSGASGMDEFKLPDGTHIRLNANSSVTYLEQGFNTEHREITLRGEADFDVNRNETLPFIINAGQSKIQVLGTSFNVAAYPGEEVVLNVTEGKVSFASVVDSQLEEVLTRGQQGIIAADGRKIEVSASENANYRGWWTRKLEYRNTRLSEVFENLKNTYWISFDYDEAMGECELTATFEDQTLDEIIEIIEATFQIKAVRKENQIKLEGKACTD